MELAAKLHEREQGESGFSFVSLMNLNKNSFLDVMKYKFLVTAYYLNHIVTQNFLKTSKTLFHMVSFILFT